MFRNRVLTTISVALIGVSALAVLDHSRDNDNTRSAPDHLKSAFPAPETKLAAALRSAESRSRLDKAASISSESRATASNGKANPLVRLDGGLLSVEARNVPLHKLLADIAEQSGIAMYSEIEADQTVSIRFFEMPLEDGLKRLLDDQDMFFLYEAKQRARQPVSLWVYPRGRGREMVPAPPESWASTFELEQALSSDSNAVVRMRAIETVIERKGPASMDSVLYALNDTHAQVRYSALSGVLSLGLTLPEGTLVNLARYDRSHFVRSLALKAIAEATGADKPQVRSMAKAALADPHPLVRTQARDVLATLKHGERPHGLSAQVHLHRGVR